MPKMPDRNAVATIVETRPSMSAADMDSPRAPPTSLYASNVVCGKAELLGSA
jgi:hypothetical protein